jgi:hypothetical protein
MEECYICFSSSDDDKFRQLSCSHNLCDYCYIRLAKPTCPLCRTDFVYNVIDTKKRHELGIINKYNKPTPLNDRLNDISAFIDYSNVLPEINQRRNRNIDIIIDDNNNIGIIGRQRKRRRRRNLSDDEIKERRRIIRERCKRKWTNINYRMAKINWFNIEVY